jgi:hypothetical protein
MPGLFLVIKIIAGSNDSNISWWGRGFPSMLVVLLSWFFAVTESRVAFQHWPKPFTVKGHCQPI